MRHYELKREAKMMDEDERHGLYDYWLQPDGLLLLSCWRRDGLTLAQIAENMGIGYRRLTRWREMYDSIDEALRTGKDVVDYRVENALLKAALGYKTKEVKVTLGKKISGGDVYQVLKETTVKEVGPNAVACLAWLNNRKHDQWKRNRDNVVDADSIDKDVAITIIRAKKDGNGDIVAVDDVPLIESVEEIDASRDDKKKVKVVTDEEAKQGGLDWWPDDWEDQEEA